MGRGVLFIDDDLDLRQAMRDLFDDLGGVSTVLAASLRELEQKRADAMGCGVAIVDINLGPGQPTGVEVASWLRGQGFNGRVIFLTGHGLGDPRVAAAAALAGTSLMSKPITADQVAQLADEVRPP